MLDIGALKTNSVLMWVDEKYNIIQAHPSINMKNTGNFLCLLPLKSQQIFKEYVEKSESSVVIDPLNLKIQNFSVLLFVNIIVLKGTKYFLLRLLDINQYKCVKTSAYHNNLIGSSRAVAHDVNNILTIIVNTCDLLFLRHLPGDESFSAIAQILDNTRLIEKLIRQLALSVNKTQVPQSNIINVNESIYELEKLISKLVGDKKIQLIINCNKKPLLTKLNSIQFESVIINLVINAIAATEIGGKLTINITKLSVDNSSRDEKCWLVPVGDSKIRKGEYILIEVSDTGTGIKNEILHQIFEECFATKKEKIRTGIGLATVYNIVIKQAKGHIRVKTSNTGTTFAIFLKAVQQ